MKHTKKNGAIAMALTLSLGLFTFLSPVSSYAYVNVNVDVNSTALAQLPQNLVTDLHGEAVVKKPLENNQLLVTVNEMDIVLNISDETLIISNKTGLPTSLTGLKVNDSVFVYYSAAMTRSLPPQSHAIAIVTEIEKEASRAQLFTIKEIISQKDGEIRALNKEGDLIVTFTKDMPLSPYKTKQMTQLSDIKVGTQLFIWYDIVAMSYPGQTGATKAVLVGQEEGLGPRAVYTPWAGLDAFHLVINKQTITMTNQKVLDRNGHLMVPLSSVAKSLGFKITWNAKDQSILLDDGTVKTTVYIGEDQYFKASSQALGLTASFSLGAPAEIIEGRTYVPASLFNLLYSDNDAVTLKMK